MCGLESADLAGVHIDHNEVDRTAEAEEASILTIGVYNPWHGTGCYSTFDLSTYY